LIACKPEDRKPTDQRAIQLTADAAADDG